MLTRMEEHREKETVDKHFFGVKDTASITNIIMRGRDFNISLFKKETHWYIDEQLQADPNMVQFLLRILHNVEVKHPVDRKENEAVLKEISLLGTTIDIFQGNDLNYSFIVSGNEEKKLSYFFHSGHSSPQVVHLPGYNASIHPLFKKSKNEWRSKNIFSGDWQSIEKVAVTYPSQPERNFEIRRFKNFFTVPGIDHPDSSRLFQYVTQLQHIEVDAFINEGVFQQYDTLLTEKPRLVVDVRSSGNKKSMSLALYEPLSDGSVLGVLPEGKMAVFSIRSVKGLVVARDAMQQKE